MDGIGNLFLYVLGGLVGVAAYKHFSSTKPSVVPAAPASLVKTNVSLAVQDRGADPQLIDSTDADYAANPSSNPENVADPLSKYGPLEDGADLYSETRRHNAGLYHPGGVSYSCSYDDMNCVKRPIRVSSTSHPYSEKAVRLQVTNFGDLKTARQMDAHNRMSLA